MDPAAEACFVGCWGTKGLSQQGAGRERHSGGRWGGARRERAPLLWGSPLPLEDTGGTVVIMTSGLFTRVTFKVSVETEFGDSVFVTGNAPILGLRPPLLAFAVCLPLRPPSSCSGLCGAGACLTL